jgi:SAM-dependent methyltransferase
MGRERLQREDRPLIHSARHDAWQLADSYDRYMGRWSRRIAPIFLDWLDPPAGLDWLEVGCGTGALTSAILDRCAPADLLAVEPSERFLAQARSRIQDPRVEFRRGDAEALPVDGSSRDAVVSGLVLNFVPDIPLALAEMTRVAGPGAVVGFYVWDYPGSGLEFVRAFWEAATDLDPAAQDLAERKRFPFCTPEALTHLVRQAGLLDITCVPIEVPTVFRDFDDFWQPFTLGGGPAPGYCAALSPDARDRLRERLRKEMPQERDGSIHLKVRAWGVRSTKADDAWLPLRT